MFDQIPCNSRTPLYPRMWCVYGHYVNNQCIYIGMGRPERAFNPHRRPTKWIEMVRDGFEVRIFEWCPTREEAERNERLLIREIKPPCNFVHTGRQQLTITNAWGVGCKHTEESKRLMAERQRAAWLETKRKGGSRKPRKPITCVQTGATYDGLRDASRKTGICPSLISMCINGHVKAAAGLNFIREG